MKLPQFTPHNVFRALTYSFAQADHEAAVHALRRAGLDDTKL